MDAQLSIGSLLSPSNFFLISISFRQSSIIKLTLSQLFFFFFLIFLLVNFYFPTSIYFSLSKIFLKLLKKKHISNILIWFVLNLKIVTKHVFIKIKNKKNIIVIKKWIWSEEVGLESEVEI